jgi:SWI/SNF-related matrix-associated actin-dependent regulator 1 of chromatin subfamily A
MDVMSAPHGGQNDRRSVDISSPIEDDYDESLPATYRTVPTQLINRSTQPTQLLEPTSPDSLFPSSPARPVVQVGASSPSQPPLARKPSLLASAMAPAGTTFRRPWIPSAPKPIQIDSDDEGPQYAGNGSDSDESMLQSDIKPANFRGKTLEKIDESPQSSQGKQRFNSITANAVYQPAPRLGSAFNPGTANGIKRTAGDMASAYGNVSKKPRQAAPSRALPVVLDEEEDLDMDDITDPRMRVIVRKMHGLFPKVTIRFCYEALLKNKGDYDDACSYLVEETSSSLGSKPRAKLVDLTGSDDELLFTPRPPSNVFANAPRSSLVNDVRQQAKKPAMSIQQKYSSTQGIAKVAPRQLAPMPRKLDIFNTPEPIVKKKTLVRGRRDPSSPVRQPSQPEVHQIESGDEASGSESEPEDLSFNGRLLSFFNTCTPEDLVDMASITKQVATYFVTKRPFRSLTAVEKVPAETRTGKQTKTLQLIGEKIYDKCHEMLKAYEAVDYLVRKCDNIAKPLAHSMNKWGVNVFGGKGEIDLPSIEAAQRACHDSGIGTPVSDDDGPVKNSVGRGGFFGQPISMAEDIKMKDYQIVGVNWLNLLYCSGHSCILADDMGLGKTCQVIGFLAHLAEVGQKGPHLVVVPAATLENWLQEFQKFAPGLVVEPYYGTLKEREKMRYTLEETRDEINVIVTTYETAKAKDDFPWLKNYGFVCGIFDEGHMLKNANSIVTKQLARIKSEFRLLLTGTPLQNNLKELISLLAFLMPALFNEKKDQLQSIFTHNVKAMDANHEALLSAQRIARARSMLTPFILRRKKNQVLKDLPKKDRNVVYCDLSPEQKELYDTQLARAYDIRERRAAGEIGLNESANVLMKLRQASIHPFLFRRLYRDKLLPTIAKQCLKDPQWVNSQAAAIVTELVAYSDMEIHHLCSTREVLKKYALRQDEWLASGKVQQMLKLLRQWMSEGHRTLVFSQFTMVLDILEVVFSKEKIKYFRLDGNTKVVERQDMIDDFCDEDNHTPVFMLSTKAGGAGINLAAANKVIVFDSGFNPQDDIQAENRAHRIGQVKDVEVVRLITRGTVEEQIYAMGLTKLKLDEQVAGDDDGESDKAKERIEAEGARRVEELFFEKLAEEKAPKIEVDTKMEDSKVDDPARSPSLSSAGTLSDDIIKEEVPAKDLAVRPKATRKSSQQSKSSNKGSQQSKLSFGKK